MEILGDEIAHEGEFMRFINRRFVDRDGDVKVWEMVERKIYGRIVMVAAVTQKNELVLIKIFRIPTRSYVLELPAGLTDQKDEKEEEVAKRELLEETGFAVAQIEHVLTGPANAGTQADEFDVFIGRGALKVQEPEPESSEDIEVVTIPLDKVVEYIKSQPEDIKVDIKIPLVLPFIS